jgi:hypothetical protein
MILVWQGKIIINHFSWWSKLGNGLRAGSSQNKRPLLSRPWQGTYFRNTPTPQLLPYTWKLCMVEHIVARISGTPPLLGCYPTTHENCAWFEHIVTCLACSSFYGNSRKWQNKPSFCRESKFSGVMRYTSYRLCQNLLIPMQHELLIWIRRWKKNLGTKDSSNELLASSTQWPTQFF